MAAAIGAVIAGVGLISSISSARQQQKAANAAYQQQYEIADRIQDFEEELQQLWRDEYKACEIAFKDEVCNMQVYEANTKLAARKAQTAVRREFMGAACKIQQCLDKECIGASCAIERDLAFAEANAAVSAMNAAVVGEEARKLARDQLRREEQYRVVGLGHQAYASTNGSALAAQIYGNYAQTASAAASRSGQAAGQYLNRLVRSIGSSGDSGGTTVTVNDFGSTNTTPSGGYEAGLSGLSGLDIGTTAQPTYVDSNTGGDFGDYGQL